MGIQAGFNSVKFLEPKFNSNVYSPVNAFQTGLETEISLSKSLSLQTSLLCFENGSAYSISYGPDAGGANTMIKIYYLRLPVNIIYKIKLGKQLNVLAGAGIYAARGLWGNEKGSWLGAFNGIIPHSGTVDNKVVFRNNPGSLIVYDTTKITAVKLYDIGYNLLAGFEWKNFQLTASFTNGLTCIFPNSDMRNSVLKFKNHSFGVSLAYLFPLKLSSRHK